MLDEKESVGMPISVDVQIRIGIGSTNQNRACRGSTWKMSAIVMRIGESRRTIIPTAETTVSMSDML